jgi:hypothetical protein
LFAGSVCRSPWFPNASAPILPPDTRYSDLKGSPIAPQAPYCSITYHISNSCDSSFSFSRSFPGELNRFAVIVCHRASPWCGARLLETMDSLIPQ